MVNASLHSLSHSKNLQIALHYTAYCSAHWPLCRVYWLIVVWLVGWTPYASLALAQVRPGMVANTGNYMELCNRITIIASVHGIV